MRISDWSSDVCSSDLGWKARMRHRVDIDGQGSPALHVDLDEIGTGRDLRAGLLQLDQNRIHYRGVGLVDAYAATCDRAGDQVTAGLDTIRHHRVRGRVQRRDATDTDRGRTIAFDLRAHCAQTIRKLDDYRIARGR